MAKKRQSIPPVVGPTEPKPAKKPKAQMSAEEREKAHIANGGGKCPYCGSTNIEGDSGEFGENCSQEVSCVDCEKRWIDLYTLTGIMEL